MMFKRFKVYVLEAKLIGFVLVMFAVLGGISYVAYLDLGKMKQRLDSVYETNLLPIIKLNSILDIYNDQVALSILKAKEQEISYIDASEILSAARYDIIRDWENYKFQYQKSEKEYVKITEAQLIKTNNYLLTLIDIYQQDKSSYIDKLSNQNFFETLTKVKNILRKIINYEVESAKFQQKLAHKAYDKLLKNIFLALIAMVIIAVMMAFVLLKRMKLRTDKIRMLERKCDVVKTQLREMTIRDPLTKLYNKQYFDEVFTREVSRASREKIPMALLVIDVDYFREYNDIYGYSMADHMLANIAKVIKEKLQRSSDYLFRLEGEELAIFISNIEQNDAVLMAEMIRKEVEDINIPHEGSKVSKYMTISIGVNAVTPLHKVEAEVFFNVAREKLSEAKSRGLNHVHY